MNIEIANKLLQLRKEKGLSQEALAQELGISRQAVSKWERAEASPDTDNLIELAKLYDISLDELLLHETHQKKTEEKIDKQEEKSVHIGLDGIHVKDRNDEVHISLKGIHVKEKEGHQVDIDGQGIYVDGEKREDYHINRKYDFPFGTLVFLGYLIYGLATGVWHPTWIILFVFPLFDSVITAIRKRKLSCFAYPILAVMIFLTLGFTQGMWHLAWVIFVTIPCYYAFANYIDHRIHS